MRPLPQGDPSWSCEQETILEEAVEMKGFLTTRMRSTLTMIRGLAEGVLVSGELSKDSHARSEVKRISNLVAHYSLRYQRRGGGRTTQ
jgi:hypothetical protein